MQAEALNEHTAALPRVVPGEPEGVFGKDTEQALRMGLVGGARGALRGLVESYATELGHWPVVILTGGDAELVGGPLVEAGLVQAVVEDLTLRGVAMAYYRTLLSPD
jgi:type III pantothenate kinase